MSSPEHYQQAHSTCQENISMTESKHISPAPLEIHKLDGDHEKAETDLWTAFDATDNPLNPCNWSPGYKWSLTLLISVVSLSVNLAILMSAPATPAILREFECEDPLYGVLLVSIWELGEVFAPLISGPLSETYGRLPVYHVTTILFIIFLCAGVSVSSIVLNPCIVGDMFRPEQRGRALSVMGMVPYVAPCLGPLIGGVVSDSLGWRWTFWILAMTTGVLELLLLLLLRETYKATIVRRQMVRLRKEGHAVDCDYLRVRSLDESNTSQFWKSILKPFKMYFSVPVLPVLSISATMSMSLCYVIITSLTGIFQATYGFSESISGLSYMGLGLGMVTGVIVGGIVSDTLHNRQGDKAQPESRLPVMAFSYLLIPLGLLVFGWTARTSIHWIVPIIATFIVGSGFTAVTLASWAYLIDAFGVFSASAVTSVTIVRNAAAASLPLAGPPLTNKLGLGLGYTVFALIGFVLSPVLFVLIRYGRRLRRVKEMPVTGR